MIQILKWILIGSFFLLLAVDVISVYSSYVKIERALNQALDAGLVAGNQAYEAQLGFARMDLGKARDSARDVMRETLRLDSNFNSDSYRNSTLTVDLVYTNNNPRLEAVYSTHIMIISGKLFGYDGIPITVAKKTPYLMEYK